TGLKKNDIRDEIVRVGEVPVWRPPAAEMPTGMQDTLEAMKAAQYRERLRLLYVAMTRAEKWLMVAAAGELSKDGSDWYQIIATAMGHINAVDVDGSGTLRFEEGGWDALPIGEEAEK